MKPKISILLSLITLPAALLAGQNGPTSEALHRASSLKVAQATFETSFVIARHETSLASPSNTASLADTHAPRSTSGSATAETQIQNVPTSLMSLRSSQLQESSNRFGSPLNESDLGHLTQ
jgi:hypothetical protein